MANNRYSTKFEDSLKPHSKRLQADLLIQNARIRTLDQKGTLAQSLAVHNGWIIGVGSNDYLMHLAGGQTEILDLRGRTVLPGFVDGHSHLSLFSETLLQLDLSASKINSAGKLLEIVRSESKRLPSGEWIRGRGYDDTKISDTQSLTRKHLDAVAPQNPVILIHVSGHLAVANSEALNRAGLDENTPDPKGGKLGRDPKTGKLTGQLFGMAVFNWFHSEAMGGEKTVVPPFERRTRKKALIDAGRILNAAGLTSVNDPLVSPIYVTSYLEAAADNSLTMRVNMLIPYFWLPELEKLGLIGNWGNEWIRCTGVKVIIDGAIAGRTAALRNGYSHDPDDHGLLIFEDPEELNELVGRIHRLGYQACLHANGDIAIDMALDAIQKAQFEYPRPHPRHRIEHCTIINESFLSRMRELGVMALPFGSYLWQHGEKIVPYYGQKRAEIMFGHKSFLEAGVHVAGASDHPAGLHPPLLGVQCMVTRKIPSGDVIGPSQKIPIEEAFKMYTAYAAYASFEEHIKGSLTPGRLADMVVLDRDPWEVDPEGISEIKVDMTIVGGHVAHRHV